MNIQKLLQMGQQMQTQLSEIQETLGNKEVSASSGGGMVTVVVDGKGEVKRLSIDPAAVDPADVEMLEDLILAALAEAQSQAQRVYEAEMKKVAAGLPFPMKLPGLF